MQRIIQERKVGPALALPDADGTGSDLHGGARLMMVKELHDQSLKIALLAFQSVQRLEKIGDDMHVPKSVALELSGIKRQLADEIGEINRRSGRLTRSEQKANV